MIEKLLKNKPAKERAKIKATEIAKFDHRGKFTVGDIKVEILSLEKIQVGHLHGVEIYARAWKNGKPLGWGKDGSVEIERFRIFNPPVLVDDPNGDIVREFVDPDTKKTKQRKLREDPIQAIRKSLAHTIKVSGKENTKVIKGKIGHTTDTFYPDADPESTSMDGWQGEGNADGLSWSELHDESGGGTPMSGAWADQPELYIGYQEDYISNKWTQLYRSMILFDTSALPDNANISSAVISIYGKEILNDVGNSIGSCIYSANPASNTDLSTADFDQYGTTELANTIAVGDFNDSAYNDHTLNASGIAAISKTGVSKFGWRESTYDAPDNTPPWQGNNCGTYPCYDRFRAYSADETGTSKDPKLVVTYTPIQTLYATVTETISLTDTLEKKANFSKTIQESISTQDALSKQASMSVTKLETLSLTDALSTIKAKIVNILDTFHLTDTLQKTTKFTKTITENISLTDTLISVKTFFATISETLHLSDAVSRTAKFAKTISETLHLSDTLTITGKFWNWITKNVSSWTNRSKHTSSWTFKDKSQPPN